MQKYTTKTLYKNGYLCDDMGRPITMTNGYSSEDERDAREAYEEYMAQKNGDNKQEEKDMQK